MQNKRILVTGGAGFLGSNLCQKLVDNNHIICLDNLLTGRTDNLKNLINHKNFKFIKHDIINPIDLQVDLIFNLACSASPPRYQADPIHTTKTSVLGSLNMLELAVKNKAKILQASTSEVYGDPLVHPQIESYKGNVNPIGIRSCYDEGKRCAESLFFDYHRTFGLDIKVIRIFNTYGPNMDPEDGRVVSNFIIQALKNEPLTMYGDGTQTRSFCYVDDLVDGIIKTMQTESSFLGPINLGNPVEYNLLDLAYLVIELTKSESKIVFYPLPSDDPCKRKPDITLARNVLGWEPKFDLKLGLLRTIEYFKTVLNLVDNESCNICRGKISCPCSSKSA